MKTIISLGMLFGVLASSSVLAQEPATLTIFAAASLTNTFEELGANFEAENPDVKIEFSFAGSSELAAQLAEGAPADIFASANQKQMAVAQEVGRIGSEPQIFAQNRLVVIVPADNPAQIRGLRDLAKEGVLLVVAAEGVPVRDYINTMLDKLAAVARYGEDYRAGFLGNIVSEEENVRQVVAKVALGEADAGIVYFSDVTPDLAVLTFPIPTRYNTIAQYPIGITDDTPHPELAQAFIEYLLSEDGQAILEKWHFIGQP